MKIYDIKFGMDGEDIQEEIIEVENVKEIVEYLKKEYSDFIYSDFISKEIHLAILNSKNCEELYVTVNPFDVEIHGLSQPIFSSEKNELKETFLTIQDDI